jgi:3-oxoacyl-[acyl-carrier protein] reductase
MDVDVSEREIRAQPLAPSQAPGPLNPRTVAVLPLVNQSIDPGQDYLCEGITDGIIFTLSLIPGLNVIGRTGVFHFKGTPITRKATLWSNRSPARKCKAIAVAGSVAKAAEVDSLFAETKKAFSKVDILVNNAGVYAFAPLEEITEGHIARIFGTNVTGLLLATKAGVALFPAEGGSVINIGSVASEQTPPMTAVYSGTKGAVDSITRVLAKELGPKKIRVNAVNPGPVATEGFKSGGLEGSDFEKQAVRATPLGRVGKPDDIASVVAFLASDDARWVTGSLIQVAGGMR